MEVTRVVAMISTCVFFEVVRLRICWSIELSDRLLSVL